MKRYILIAIVCALIPATPALADDFDRPGWYVGVGAGVGADFLSEAISNAVGGAIEIRPTGSFNARGGYRVLSWLAFEGMYEGIYGIETQVLGVEVLSSSFHSLLFNMKLIVPTWRLQPYFIFGTGAQQGTADAMGVLSGLDLSRWDLTIRTGFGLDAYVSKHWLINLELTPSVRLRDYIEVLEITDNVNLTFSVGAQYRF